MTAVQPVLGLIELMALAWAISVNRRAFPWRVLAVGLALRFALALLLIKLPGSQVAFAWIGHGVDALMRATEAGTSFVFGYLGGVGIMVGGVGAIVPERRLEIAQLGLKSIVAGSMATCMTGAIAGLLTW